jgi:uroporphyrinogen-III synthase
MRLLLTRPRSEAEGLAKALAERGIESLIAPVMEIMPLTLELPENAKYQAVMLTSGNAVDALISAGLSADLPVFCVGDATARRLATTSFKDVRSAAGMSDDLVELVSRDLSPNGDPVLYLSGMMIAADIGAALVEAGFTIDRRVVYRAQAIEKPDEAVTVALADGSVDGVMFYSPRSARIFLDHLKHAKLELMAKEMTAYCISSAAADTARALTWRKVAVASRPNQVDLLALLPN